MNEKYNELFKSDNDKAKAFDKIAECYYNKNFGSIIKSDIDLLMFSIYIEQILDKSEDDINTYSDYILAKDLGITQSKVRNFKERKQQKYPYEKFDWKKSFERVSRNATYENGKVKIELRDKNLYNEIKNAIEESGGYVEVQLNSSLLQVPLNYYIDFLCNIDKKNPKVIKSELKKIFREHSIEYIDTRPIIEQLKDSGKDVAINIFEDIIKEIPFSNAIKSIIKNTKNLVINNL